MLGSYCEHVSPLAYRKQHPDRRYAVAKRVLSRQELRRHAVMIT